MTAQEHIKQELESIKNFHAKKISKENPADEIFSLLMSKKFRKYSAKPELVEHIKKAIEINIENNQPINFTFPHGAYKLWRLEEAPLPDWAELFSAMHYSKWVKTICEIYEPGVWFDFFVDDLIVPILNNTPKEDVEEYLKEWQNILDFLKNYQPKNLNMTITQFKDRYSQPEPFEEALEENIKNLKKTNPTFTEEQLQVVQLNARPTPEQLKDKYWREKILIIHDAYMPIKRGLGYYSKTDKIGVFSQPLPSGMFLVPGTTKTSIAKFWVGVGALKKDGESFKEYVLSPKQLESANFEWEEINIDGLEGKNFKKIRILPDLN